MNDKIKQRARELYANEWSKIDSHYAARIRSGDILATPEIRAITEALNESAPKPEAQAAGVTDADISKWDAWRGIGMISAVGEYTPDEFWQLLDEVKRLRALSTPASHDAQHVNTGVFDSSGAEIRAGDRIVIRICDEHTKKEYWNPEYVVVWDAPSFKLEWVGGGKSSDTARWYFDLGTEEGYENLEILERSPTALAQQPAVVGDAEVARYWRDRAQRAEALSFSMSPGPGPQKGCRLDAAGNPMREVSPGVWQSALAWPDAALTPAATPGAPSIPFNEKAVGVVADSLTGQGWATGGDAEDFFMDVKSAMELAAQKEGNGNG